MTSATQDLGKGSPLTGVECEDCGRRFLSERQICRNCGSTSVNSVQLSDRGSLLTHTVIRHPPSPFVGEEPYVVGVVELDDGARVLANIVGLDGNDEGGRVALEDNGKGRLSFRILNGEGPSDQE
jgi:uncharacterized OB-fold protein